MAAQDNPSIPPPLPDLEDRADEHSHASGQASKSLGKRVALIGVIAFLTVTAAISLNALFGSSGWIAPIGGRKAEWLVEGEMSNLLSAIGNYRLTHKKLPTSLKELTQTSERYPYPFIKSIPDDPWGNPYVYRVIDKHKFDLRSMGEDGVANTGDDITTMDD